MSSNSWVGAVSLNRYVRCSGHSKPAVRNRLPITAANAVRCNTNGVWVLCCAASQPRKRSSTNAMACDDTPPAAVDAGEKRELVRLVR